MDQTRFLNATGNECTVAGIRCSESQNVSRKYMASKWETINFNYTGIHVLKTIVIHLFHRRQQSKRYNPIRDIPSQRSWIPWNGKWQFLVSQIPASMSSLTRLFLVDLVLNELTGRLIMFTVHYSQWSISFSLPTFFVRNSFCVSLQIDKSQKTGCEWQLSHR